MGGGARERRADVTARAREGRNERLDREGVFNARPRTLHSARFDLSYGWEFSENSRTSPGHFEGFPPGGRGGGGVYMRRKIASKVLGAVAQ